MWYPVQSTFERVKNSETDYISIEQILEQLTKVTENIFIIDALELANKAGNPLTSNVVLLGSLAKIEGFPISLEQLKEIIPRVVPKKAIEANLKALLLGFEAL